jgi:uncharacterized protein YxeA
MSKIMYLFLSLVICTICAAVLTPRTLAFDLFSNCITVTNNDGTKTQECGPCKNNPDAPTCQQAQNEGSDTNNRVTGPKNIINSAANILAVITGIGAVIMIIIGGLTMVTSAGRSESVATARRRIIYSLVGLVVVALSWAIIRFITDKLIQ